MSNLICDTNVFYNLGAGTLTSSTLAQPGDRVFYSPITPIELAGKWSDRTHAERRAAAEAILKSGASELPDPETWLARAFAYTPAAPFSFGEGVIAMAQTTSLAQLAAGVKDVPQGVVRRVSVTAAGRWRATTEGKWVKDMLAIQTAKIPGFKKWWDPDPAKRKGAVPKLKGKEKKDFLAMTTSHLWLMQVIVGCQDRALLAANRSLLLPPDRVAVAKFAAAIAAISCYVAVYTQYLARLLTESALPNENDSGDLELFIYSKDDDHVIVTSEKKWKTMAEKAGYGNRVRLV